MDDIHLDDPRKYSAKQIKKSIRNARNKRKIWQYLFDLIFKTAILASVLSIDFTLFANSGNYSLFSSSKWLNPEVQYIYIAIVFLSFAIIFLTSFVKVFENIVLALAFALTSLAIINQFATFEKHSALLIMFDGIFSDNMNAMLYEYSFWIIGGVVFMLFWWLFSVTRRQFMFYFTLVIMSLLGWLISESYFKTGYQYFRTIKSSPIVKTQEKGKNLVFLSFNNLTSPNTLKRLYKQNKKYQNLQDGFYNSVGFYSKNAFTLYPNALVGNANEPFYNLIESFNPKSKENVSKNISSSATRSDYFNFNALQSDRMYLKNNEMFDMLQKKGYLIHVYQTRGVDVCFRGTGKDVATCKEKINMPMYFESESFSKEHRILMLIDGWLNSTGFISSINPVLKVINYAYEDKNIRPREYEIDELYSINSYKVFDQIVEEMKKRKGNNAYFAVVDMPSNTFVYDAFCKIKVIDDWISEENSPYSKKTIDDRREAYADQVNCLYGYLEKFVQQLKKDDNLDNTTIIIQGLDNPIALVKKDADYYRNLQDQKQVTLAIRPAKSTQAKFDYKVCSVKDILSGYFFTGKKCNEFAGIKIDDKKMRQIRDMIDKDKYSSNEISTATSNFSKWFAAWKAYNPFDGAYDEKIKSEVKADEQPKVIEKADVEIKEVQEVPEEKLKSISAVVEKTIAEGQEVVDTTKDTAKNVADKIDAIEEKTEEIVEKAGAEAKEIVEKTTDIVENVVNSISETESGQTIDAVNEAVPEVKIVDVTEENSPEIIEMGQDVIPDAVLDEEVKEDNSTEEAIEKAKQALKEKEDLMAIEAENLKIRVAEAMKNSEEKAESSIEMGDTVAEPLQDELRKVLVAPVAEGQNLSPEELKKEYHKVLKETVKKVEKDINIEVKVIEQ